MCTELALIQSAQRILVLLGAGASTSSGLVDFRSAGGLYFQPELASLGDPQILFDARVFREEPELLWLHLGRLLPPVPPRPGPVHRWLAHAASQGRILKVYTQNVDGLEAVAGVPSQLLVEAHGNLRAARCVCCGARTPMAALAAHVAQRRVPFCRGVGCAGALRPEVAFFHEALPAWDPPAVQRDAAAADLVLVVGTSLRAAPLAHLPSLSPPAVPRLLVNGEDVAPPAGAPFAWRARLLGDAGAILWATEGGDPRGEAEPCGAWRACAGGALSCDAAPVCAPLSVEGGVVEAQVSPPQTSRAGRPLKRARHRAL